MRTSRQLMIGLRAFSLPCEPSPTPAKEGLPEAAAPEPSSVSGAAVGRIHVQDDSHPRRGRCLGIDTQRDAGNGPTAQTDRPAPVPRVIGQPLGGSPPGGAQSPCGTSEVRTTPHGDPSFGDTETFEAAPRDTCARAPVPGRVSQARDFAHTSSRSPTAGPTLHTASHPRGTRRQGPGRPQSWTSGVPLRRLAPPFF